jgi:heme-degrading monooxygenase HmoA
VFERLELTVVDYFNCFEVPAGREEAFLERFRAVNAYMVRKPGYLSHQLCRSLGTDASFRFINHAVWESPEQFQAAHDEGFRALLADPAWREFTAQGALYEVVHEGSASY